MHMRIGAAASVGDHNTEDGQEDAGVNRHWEAGGKTSYLRWSQASWKWFGIKMMEWRRTRNGWKLG